MSLPKGGSEHFQKITDIFSIFTEGFFFSHTVDYLRFFPSDFRSFTGKKPKIFKEGISFNNKKKTLPTHTSLNKQV